MGVRLVDKYWGFEIKNVRLKKVVDIVLDTWEIVTSFTSTIWFLFATTVILHYILAYLKLSDEMNSFLIIIAYSVIMRRIGIRKHAIKTLWEVKSDGIEED